MKQFQNTKNSHTYTHYLDNVSHTERQGELLTIYQDAEGAWHARPTEMFHGMRTTKTGEQVKRFIEIPHEMRPNIESMFNVFQAQNELKIRQDYIPDVKSEAGIPEDATEPSEGFRIVVGVDAIDRPKLDGVIVFSPTESDDSVQIHSCRVTKSFDIGADPIIIATAHKVFEHFRVIDGECLTIRATDGGYEVSGTKRMRFTEVI